MEPNVYFITVINNYEQPTQPVYDVIPGHKKEQPAPPPYSTHVHSLQVAETPPPFRWSLRKKILIPIGTISVIAVLILIPVLTVYFVYSSYGSYGSYYTDCYYGEYGTNCPTSCRMYCNSSNWCIRDYQICNGVQDCPYGEDERNCVRLYGADFQLQVYSPLKSAWLPVCADDWNDDFGRFACQDFGYNRSSYNRYETLESSYAPRGYFMLYYGDRRSKFYASVQYSYFCYTGNVVSLHCIRCGVSYNNANSLTVGGTNTSLGNWPWQVSLRQKTGAFCGGSIISPKWIVTAAQCVYGSYSNASGWKVFTGTLTSPNYNDTKAYSVERIIAHPGYNSITYDNDIALMKLTDEITFGYDTQPVCLPNSGMSWEAGTTFWLSGWGTTSQGGNVSAYLQYAAVPLIDSNVCNQYDMYNGSITSSMICAGYLNGSIDTCQGDSGGPLVTKRNGTWWLVGDTSWGDGCARAYKPGVYGNMTTFLEWIYLQMRIYV